MKRILVLVSCLALVTAAFTGCRQGYRRPEVPVREPAADTEATYRTNRLMIRKNAESIRNESARRGWNLTETGTGVFFQILRTSVPGRSELIKPGDRVTLSYTLDLLDGTRCYSSESEGPKRFVVEKSEAEQGLHETLQLLHEGDSALVVIPPQKAFGLAGDGNKIPPQSVLVYHFRVDSVERKSGK